MASLDHLPPEWKETADMLISMGFSEGDAVLAAQNFGVDIESAALYLSEQPVRVDPTLGAHSVASEPLSGTRTDVKKETTSSARTGTSATAARHFVAKTGFDEVAYKRRLLCDAEFDDEYLYEYLHVDVSQLMHELMPSLRAAGDEHSEATTTSAAVIGSSLDSGTATDGTQSYAIDVSAMAASEFGFGDVIQEPLRSRYALHKAAHAGDSFSLNRLKTNPAMQRALAEAINSVDPWGNTPLSLALRRTTLDDGFDGSSTVHLLLEMGAEPSALIEACGWTAMQEACLRGDTAMVTDMLIHDIQRRGSQYESQKLSLISRLLALKDFKLEIEWKIASSVPMLESLIASRFGKAENFKIWKQGANLRFDAFVRGFSASGVAKGHLSFLFKEDGSITSVDHDLMQFENAIRKFKNPDFEELQEQIRMLMETDVGNAMMTSTDVKLSRKKDWRKRERTESVGGYKCGIYALSGLQFRVIGPHSDASKRWTLPPFVDYFADILQEEAEEAKLSSVKAAKKKKRKRGSVDFLRDALSLVSSAATGSGAAEGSRKKKKKKRKSAFAAHPTDIVKVDRSVDVTLWLSKGFPLSQRDIQVILEVVSIANEDMRRLCEILKLQMTAGFPLKLNIPVVVGVFADVSFCNFQFTTDFEDDLFHIPPHYHLV